MITLPVHISPKGQLVLPKAVKAALGSQNVIFEITDQQVVIKPALSVSGALAQYKKNYEDFADVREQAWEESCHDR